MTPRFLARRFPALRLVTPRFSAPRGARPVRAVLRVAAGLTVLLAASCGGSGDESEEAGGGDGADLAPSGEDAGGTAGRETSDGAAPDDDDVPPPVPSPGCVAASADPAAGGAAALDRERVDLDVDGMARWYLVTAPAPDAGDDPVPLVVDLHGLSEGAEFHADSTGWSELAAAEGFVAVFPHGSGRTVGWDIRSSGPNPDIDFIDALVADVGRRHCIDTSRTYATGLSNGAFMSSVLACTRSGTFAAVAPVAGVTHPEDCAPGRPVPLVGFHGTADPLLPFNGSVSAGAVEGIGSGTGVTTTEPPAGDPDGPGYPRNAAEWAEANGCEGPTDERITASVVRRSWDCPPEGEVVFHVVEGGGHTWPGSDGLADSAIAAIVGPTNMEIDATELTWEFFSRHRLPA